MRLWTKSPHLFDMEPMEVYAIAGFYNMFYKEPKGKFHLEVCTNVPCMLRGAGEIADYIKAALGDWFGETTEDGNFTLDHMECLGSCGTAPMVFARRTPERLGTLLRESDARAGRRHVG